jgi:hypothetical protein
MLNTRYVRGITRSGQRLLPKGGESNRRTCGWSFLVRDNPNYAIFFHLLVRTFHMRFSLTMRFCHSGLNQVITLVTDS